MMKILNGYSSATLLLLISSVPYYSSAFTTSPFYNSPTALGIRENNALSLAATSVTLPNAAVPTSGQQQPPKEEAQELLQLLLQNYQTKKPTTNKDRQVIGNYIDSLSNAKVTFDPAQCLNGPFLYAVLHQQGPKVPLWEKIGLFQQSSNIKGQKFILLEDPTAETRTFDIVNYAEVFGKDLFIEVKGTAKPAAPSQQGEPSDSSPTQQSTTPSFLDGFSKLFSPFAPSPATSSKSLSLFQCPCEIEATVNGGGLFTASDNNDTDNSQRLLLDLPMIQGKGLVRVLYADPKLRIFESPTQGDGGWEDKGLIVVQVRQDLLLL